MYVDASGLAGFDTPDHFDLEQYWADLKAAGMPPLGAVAGTKWRLAHGWKQSDFDAERAWLEVAREIYQADLKERDEQNKNAHGTSRTPEQLREETIVGFLQHWAVTNGLRVELNMPAGTVYGPYGGYTITHAELLDLLDRYDIGHELTIDGKIQTGFTTPDGEDWDGELPDEDPPAYFPDDDDDDDQGDTAGDPPADIPQSRPRTRPAGAPRALPARRRVGGAVVTDAPPARNTALFAVGGLALLAWMALR